MPRYDYECEVCHHRFELRQSFDSEPTVDCPECMGTARRKFHSVPVVFKGSGWYVNDYGKRASSSTSKTESTEEAAGSKKKSDSSESASTSTSSSESKSETTTAKAKAD